VAAVVHDDRGRVLLVRHNKYGRWMCPGGHVDPDELPHDTALREVQEETGLRVRLLPNAERRELGDERARVLPTPFCVLEEQVASGNAYIDLVYRCQATDDTAPRPDGVETAEVRWFTADEIAAWQGEETFENIRRIALCSVRLFLAQTGGGR
jgi:8-oxo-dGTP pyrophosphatase MutT (NUDIX family)